MSGDQIIKLATEQLSDPPHGWPQGLTETEEILLLEEMVRQKRELIAKETATAH